MKTILLAILYTGLIIAGLILVAVILYYIPSNIRVTLWFVSMVICLISLWIIIYTSIKK